ncbi:uncharacterized protein LOC109538679 isoform X2 [Dendroctonus ponderosae]|uniref:uncharacterized protein LOC109538679 isoform X2 n=1 Tax=Dendroctonus ponderosae TaxID=77166 RepID=UPI002034D0A6|nr:uncharacterized protein LOC109538679 isoform X2 [Dendroctonus ponderosae]KAH1024651.1 hypothetical protein HUJ05_004105 [Dendroctonus ponderosae]
MTSQNSPINKQNIISACVPPTNKKGRRKKKELSSTAKFIVFSILRSRPVGKFKMLSAGIVRNILLLSGGCLLMIDRVIGVPVPEREEKDLTLVPFNLPASRFVQVPVSMFQPQFYQQQSMQDPKQFGIGQWIQQTPWLPIQVNIPDLFQNIGNGISQATNGVTQFTQNVGTGLNQFTQNVGSGFNQWMQQLGQRIPILGNIAANRLPMNRPNGQRPVFVMIPVEYPGGQQLIMEEALEAFP